LAVPPKQHRGSGIPQLITPTVRATVCTAWWCRSADDDGNELPGVPRRIAIYKGGLPGVDTAASSSTTCAFRARISLNSTPTWAEDGTYSSPIENPDAGSSP